jgi:hypothetical protein
MGAFTNPSGSPGPSIAFECLDECVGLVPQAARSLEHRRSGTGRCGAVETLTKALLHPFGQASTSAHATCTGPQVGIPDIQGHFPRQKLRIRGATVVSAGEPGRVGSHSWAVCTRRTAQLGLIPSARRQVRRKGKDGMQASFRIPSRLTATCLTRPESWTWLESLPKVLTHLERRWSLTLGEPFDGDDVSCSWVAPVALADGTRAVLKVSLPHMENEHEIQGLRFWNGDPMVRLLEADDDSGGMLLELCEPGTVLRGLPESEQDVVIARLLRRAWRSPGASHAFRPLSKMLAQWSDETLAAADYWPDPELVREGLGLFRSCREVRLRTCCWSPTSTLATCFAPSASRGSLSIRSHSWAIPPTMPPNTC